MKQQILVIHGGESFDTYEEYLEALKAFEINIGDLKKTSKWKDKLQENLGDDFEVLLPSMPCRWNGKYAEWKIWFNKFIPYFQDNLILIGHSQGGIFLTKYLSENNFPVKIKATFLLAAPYDEKDADYSLADFVLPESLEKLEKQGGKIFLYHSKDDPIVPFADLEKYAKKLPSAEKVIFEDKGHFLAQEFPEIVEKLKKLK